METYISFWGIKIITICESSNSHRYFFSHEDHWKISIIRDIDNEMPRANEKPAAQNGCNWGMPWIVDGC